MGILTVKSLQDIFKHQNPDSIVEIVKRKLYVSDGLNVHAIIDFETGTREVALHDSISDAARKCKSNRIADEAGIARRRDSEDHRDAQTSHQRDHEINKRPDYPRCE